MRAPVRSAIVLAAAVAALALPGRAAAGLGRVESVVGVGGTFAVAGEPDNGGVSLGLSFMWPIEDHLRVGVMGMADELGNAVTRLTGPGGVDLGPVTAGERYTWGGAARIEGHAATGHAFDPFAVLTWGVQKVQDDLRGTSQNTDYAASLGVGAGVLRSINAQHAIGLVLRGQFLSHGDAQRYLSATLEWRWGWNNPGGTATPR